MSYSSLTTLLCFLNIAKQIVIFDGNLEMLDIRAITPQSSSTRPCPALFIPSSMNRSRLYTRTHCLIIRTGRFSRHYFMYSIVRWSTTVPVHVVILPAKSVYVTRLARVRATSHLGGERSLVLRFQSSSRRTQLDQLYVMSAQWLGGFSARTGLFPVRTVKSMRHWPKQDYINYVSIVYSVSSVIRLGSQRHSSWAEHSLAKR